MYCENCGAEVRGTFCTKCGTRAAPSPPPDASPRQAESGSGDPEATATLRAEDLQAFERAQASPSDPGWSQTAQPPPPAAPSSEGWQTTTPVSPPPGPAGATSPQSLPTGGGPHPDQPAQTAWQTPPNSASPPPFRVPASAGNWGSNIGFIHGNEALQNALAPLQNVGNQVIAWIGSGLLLFGTFLPVKAFSIFSFSFWDLSKGTALILTLMAVLSAGVAYLRDYKWLWITGLIALFFLFINLFDALFGAGWHPSWGWIVLIPANALILAAAALRPRAGEVPGDAIRFVNEKISQSSGGRKV